MRNQQDTSEEDVGRILGIDKTSHINNRKRVLAGLALLILLATYIGKQWIGGEDSDITQYKTQPAERGNLTVTVTATGTLEPVNQVEVGSELSGTIESIEVNFNDIVQHNQLLARFSTDQLESKVAQSTASLESAQAKVREAVATVLEAKLKLRRCEELAQKHMCSQESVDTATAAYDRSIAAEASARAQVSQVRAILNTDKMNLAKAEIRSPINGIVLDRKVDMGQTVAASLQTPVLFILAEDLTKMELHVDVDEADIGKVKVAQTATFNVDAYPERDFRAEITEIRFSPKSIEGVVTYETLLSLDNSDLSLRPGMTATADIIVKQVDDVLLVPNSALRFSPPVEIDGSADKRRGLFSFLPSPPSQEKESEDLTTSRKQKQVWILRDNEPVAVEIKTGSTDDRMTEILSGNIKPGVPLIIEMIETD